MNISLAKQIIGKYIQYYRHKKKITQKQITTKIGSDYRQYAKSCRQECTRNNLCLEANSICSTKILKRIENGEIFDLDCYYIGLVENLGFHFLLNDIIIKDTQQAESLLADFIIHMSISSYEKLSSFIEYLEKSYPNIFFFSDLFNLYKNIMCYYYEKKLPTNINEDFYDFLFEYADESTKNLLVIYSYESLLFPKRNTYFEEIISNHQSEPLFFNSYIISLSQNEASSISMENINTFYKKNADHFITCNFYYYYNYLAFIYLNDFHLNTANIYIEKCLDIINNSLERLIPNLKLKMLSNYAVTLFFMNEFKKSCDIFIKLINENINILFSHNLIFLFYMLEKENDNRLNELLQIDFKACLNSKEMLSIFAYYKLKHSQSVMILSLMKDCSCFIVEKLSFLDKGSRAREIIEEDLKIYTKKTKNADLLLQYIE